MGWQDRDYSDAPLGEPTPTAAGLRRPPGLTLALMLLHGGALFVMLATAEGSATPPAAAITLHATSISLLGIVLHPIASAGLLTTLFVVLALWSLAGRIERRRGAMRLAVVYVIANTVAGAAYAATANAAPHLARAELDYPVGVLAGLCLLAWRHFRAEPVQVLGRMTTIGTVYLVCAAIVAGLVVLRDGVGSAAWLIAAGAGACATGVLEWLPTARTAARRPRVPRRRPAPRRRTAPADDPELDALLAKISAEGIDALSEAERERLERARRRRLGDD